MIKGQFIIEYNVANVHTPNSKSHKNRKDKQAQKRKPINKHLHLGPVSFLTNLERQVSAKNDHHTKLRGTIG